MKELLNKYSTVVSPYKEKCNNILEFLKEHNLGREYLYNELEKKTRELFLERNFCGSTWEFEVRSFVSNLMRELRDRYGFNHFEGWGPFPISACGAVVLGHESFRKEENGELKFIPEKALRLNVVPVLREDGVFTFEYKTLKRIEKYEKGTVGDMNGLNTISAPFPDTFEEVLQIMKEQYKEKYGRDYGSDLL